MFNLSRQLIRSVQRPRPPGPRGIEIARALADYRSNGLSAIERLIARYGDVVYVNLVAFEAFLLGNPELIHHVLMANRDLYVKIPGSKIVQRYFGNAMQLDNGEYARRMRRMIAPAFQPERVAKAYSELIVRETRRTIDCWEQGPRPGITQELMDLILNIAVQIHFGTEPGEETRRLGRLFVTTMSLLSNFMLPEWVPSPHNRRYRAAVATLDADVMQRIRARRSEGTQRLDLLSTLLRAQDDQGRTLSDRQVRNEIISMMSAGYQSVGIALNQMLRLVAENPAVDARLAEELADSSGDLPSASDLARFGYAEKIVTESLRCCPPAGVIARRAVADDTIDGWTIPAGARVFMSAWAMHHDPRFYEDPIAFRPERWTQEFKRSLPVCAYFPFGRGPRSCLASALTTLILQLMLVTIAPRYRLEALRRVPAPLTSWPSILAQGGLQVTIHPRRDREVSVGA